MPSCIMLDLSPSWDEETIALLIGKTLFSTSSKNTTSALVIPSDSVVVEMIVTDANNEDDYNNNETRISKSTVSKTNTTQARVMFASASEQRCVIEAYDGLAVPMTHGYHYYRFSDARYQPINEDISDSKLSKIFSETPPLHLQLNALPSKELHRRTQMIELECEVTKSNCNDYSKHKDKKQKGSNKRCRVHKHALQCFQLCRHFKNSPRPERQMLGVPVPPGSINYLLQYLRRCSLWPPAERQRKGVSAGNYLTVRKQHPPDHDEIWSLCRDLIDRVVPDVVYSALAITKAFVGSPHIDAHDTTFQHVIALGDFEGGMLCTEADCDGTQTVAIDVRNRFGRIDGRGVHWVSGWKGERYSIVYYSTTKEDQTERVSQSVHNEWMENMQRNDRSA